MAKGILNKKEDQSKKKINFGLTKEEFNSLRIELTEGNEDLFEKIFVSQAHASIKMLQKKFGLSYEDGYDATMETLIQFRKILIQGKLEYGNLRYIFNRMAKFFVMKKKKRTQEFSSDEIEIFELKNLQNNYDDEEIEKIKSVWINLEEEEKKILYLHFNLGARLKDIAQNLDISEAAVRKRKQRVLTKIKSQFQIVNHV